MSPALRLLRIHNRVPVKIWKLTEKARKIQRRPSTSKRSRPNKHETGEHRAPGFVEPSDWVQMQMPLLEGFLSQ